MCVNPCYVCVLILVTYVCKSLFNLFHMWVSILVIPCYVWVVCSGNIGCFFICYLKKIFITLVSEVSFL